MSIDSRLHAQLTALCAELGPLDGVDPRTESRHRRPKAGADRKLRQLCKQVAVAVELALRELGDPALANLAVVGVVPDDVRNRLRVCVTPTTEASPENHAIHERLLPVRGRLREQVAGAIRRRYVPELSFDVR